MDKSSAELLDRFRRGEERSADDLFHRYVERLTSMVRRQLGPSLRRRIDPEDAVHSAYRSFFGRAGRGDFVLEHSGDLWKLLVAITLNKLRRQIAHHQADKRTAERDRSLDAGIMLSASGPSPLEALAAADELQSLMAKLSPIQRTILEMRLRDHTWAEIVTATGRPDRSVRRVIEEIREVWLRQIPTGLPEVSVAPANIDSTTARNDSPPEELLDYRDFLLKELVGDGGMGKVYRAWHHAGQCQVAVKMLRKPQWDAPESVSRFLEEARIVSRLRHPGIIGLRGVGATPGGGLFLVMDFIEGFNLERVIANGKPSCHQAVDWIAQAADILNHAHAAGIIHCDLKPGNLMLEHTGRIMVGDFGLATRLDSVSPLRMWAGTPGYMAPEQLDSSLGNICAATDVFALGLVLVRLLTGKVPFEGPRILEVLCTENHPATWWRDSADELIPTELDAVLARCLALDPSDRFKSSAELSQCLQAILPAL